MRCELEFLIRNDSGMDVTIETISVPVLGPQAGAGAKATILSPIRSGVIGPLPNEVDAIWELDDRLASGATLGYIITIEFAAGCNAGHVAFPKWPTVEIASLGRTLEAESVTLPFGIGGSQHTACSG